MILIVAIALSGTYYEGAYVLPVVLTVGGLGLIRAFLWDLPREGT